MHRRSLKILLFVLILGLSVSSVLYALTILVESVTGDVEVRTGGVWKTATPGMQLAVGDELATSFDSTAVLKFEDNSVVNVTPLTQFAIDRFLKDSSAVHTDIALKIGEVKARVVQNAPLPSDFVIITPTSVVSVRGTEEDVLTSDKGTEVSYAEGKGQAMNERRQRSYVAATQSASVAPDGKITDAIQTGTNRSRSTGTKDSGLTAAEVEIADEIFSDPTGDPGSASEGQSAATDTDDQLSESNVTEES